MKRYKLEGTITAENYALLADACTATWDRSFKETESGRQATEDVVFRRHDHTVSFLVPWLNKVFPLRDTLWIDFGAGCGSSSLGLSYFVKQVMSYEIDKPSIQAFQTRMSIFEPPNVVYSGKTENPDQLMSDAVDATRRFGTSVLMLAVLEHMLEEERLSYLRAFWDALRPGQILVVAETPNLACWFDTHTHQEPLLHLLSDEVFFSYLSRRDSQLRFRDPLLHRFEKDGINAAHIDRWRYGIGVTHHLFEAAFGCDLNEIVIADGFSPEMLSWFPTIPDDRLLASLFDVYGIRVPAGFCRSVLSFIFRKPTSSAKAGEIKKWNDRRRAKIILDYSFFQRVWRLSRMLARGKRLVSRSAR